MSYLSFDTFTAAVPLASAATHIYNLKRPVGSLSASAGYDVDYAAGTGTFRVSALIDGVVLSAVQVAASSGTITFPGASVAEGAALQVRVAHLSGGDAEDLIVVLDSNASVTLGELEFVSASFTYGVTDIGSLPVLSATKVSPAAGSSTLITTLSTTVNATTTLSSNQVVNTSIAPNVYLLQGDTFAWTTRQAALSSFTGATNSVTISFDTAEYSGSRSIKDHLRGRNLGYF